MVLTLKSPLREAQKAKKEITKKKLLDIRYNYFKDNDFIYFPVKKKFKSKYQFVNKNIKIREEKQDLKEKLSKVLTKKDLENLNTSMDIIGSIAIIEIPNELSKKEKLIAKELLSTNNHIKTVLKKGVHKGVFRTQKLKHLAGTRTKEAICKENRVVLKLDVEKVYFSPRTSTERLRIANLVKPNEDVLVMFSGCAPFNCVIAKKSLAASVDGIEINPDGHRYGLENLKLNKIKNSVLYRGDVHKIAPVLGKKYDRIIMPLPKTAEEFLSDAFNLCKPSAVIHFYDFEFESEEQKGVEKFQKACLAANKKCKLLKTTKTTQSGPRTYRYCYDFEVQQK